MEDIKLQSPIQWVGGKKRIINNITNYIPKHFEQYHELFLGGGALLFHLKHNKSIINELNPNLINLYNNDFKEQVKYIKTNDLVYMDPPYYNTFTGYNKEKWTQENSLEVLHIFKSLTEKGIAVILSNNNDQEYIKIVNDILIIDSYKIIEVSISRTLNMNISERKKKKCEILIINKYCNI